MAFAKLVCRAYADAADVELWAINPTINMPEPDDIYYDEDVNIVKYSAATPVSNYTLSKNMQTRLDLLQADGIDISNLDIQTGVYKQGFPEYLLRLQKRLSECDVSNQQFEELIREKYKLNQEQYCSTFSSP